MSEEQEQQTKRSLLKQHKKNILLGVPLYGGIALIIIIGAVGSHIKSKNTSSNTKTSSSSNVQYNPNAGESLGSVPETTQPAATPATRQVEGTAVTLGAGTFSGGQDVAVGLYNVTTAAGQSGNFIVTGTDNYNEILGVSDVQGVPSVRAQITSGDQIQLSGLSSVTFTPVTTSFVTTHTAVTLGAGTWVVGQDIGAGRYVATPGAGQSGNFIVTGNDSYNEILGSDASMDEVPNVTATLTDGDVVQISGMSQVTMTPTN